MVDLATGWLLAQPGVSCLLVRASNRVCRRRHLMRATRCQLRYLRDAGGRIHAGTSSA